MKDRDSQQPSFVMPVTDATFKELVLDTSATIPVIVDFWAPWCGPCMRFKPIFESYAERLAGHAMLYTLNTDENRATALKYNVRSIPSLRVFENGAEKPWTASTTTGYFEGLEELLKSFLQKK